MRTPADLLSVAMTEIVARAEGHIHTPCADTISWIAGRARAALTEAASAETIIRMESALAEARQRLKS